MANPNILDEAALKEIEIELQVVLPNSEYNESNESPQVCQICSGATDDHRGNCVVPMLYTMITTIRSLQAELDTEKRLRHELKQIAQTGIAEVSSVGSALSQTALIDYRARILEAIRAKADEWDRAGNESSRDDIETLLFTKAVAAREILKMIEEMKS